MADEVAVSALLEAKQLKSVRGERTLFSDLNLVVDAGQIWHVSGPNGAGKSSLLRILAGLLTPDHGRVLFRGEDSHEQRQLFLSSLLFIGHKAAVKSELTAIENLEFFAAVQGQPLTAPPFELLAKVGLVGLEDVPAIQLSAGQQRRIALARLWLTQAPLWILDEPFTAIDVAGTALLQQRFQQHCDGGGSIIMTSHQPLNQLGANVQELQLEYNW